MIGHAIFCNDAIMHIVLGTEDEAQCMLEELAKEDYDAKAPFMEARYFGHLGLTSRGVPSYKAYRQWLYWHIHTIDVSSSFDGEIVATGKSSADVAIIQWISDYRPKIGDKLLAIRSSDENQ